MYTTFRADTGAPLRFRDVGSFTYHQDGDRAEYQGEILRYFEERTEPVGRLNVVAIQDPAARPYVIAYHDDVNSPNTAAVASPVREGLAGLRSMERQSQWLQDGYLYEGLMERGGLPIHEVLAGSDRLVLEADQDVDGVRCHVLSASTRHGTVRVFIDPEAGYLARRVEYEIGPDDLWYGRPLGEQASGWGSRRLMLRRTIVLDSMRIELIDGRFVPVSGRIRSTEVSDTGEEVSRDLSFRRTDVRLDPDFDALNAFSTVNIVEGTAVLFDGEVDRIEGVPYVWRGGDIRPAVDEEVVRRIEESLAMLTDDSGDVGGGSDGLDAGATGSGTPPAANLQGVGASMGQVVWVGLLALAVVACAIVVWTVRRREVRSERESA